MPVVLFVCTANLYRSPLAEALFSRKLKESQAKVGEWRVASAGTWAVEGSVPPAETLQAGGALGLDLKGHRARLVSLELLRGSDLVVMEKGQKEALKIEFPEEGRKIRLLSEVVDGIEYSVPDPFLGDGEGEGEIGVEIAAMIERGWEKICRLAKGKVFDV